jgi:hypothetical protein
VERDLTATNAALAALPAADRAAPACYVGKRREATTTC